MTLPATRPWRPFSRPIWDPTGELTQLRSEILRMLGALSGTDGWTNDVEMTETDDGWLVTARLPGVAPEEVTVELEGRELSIRGRAEAEEESEEMQEFQRSAFHYRLTLPNEVDQDRVDATMDHGLLRVHLPRSPQARRRAITIGRPASGNGQARSTG
ncbi:MAG TPA: Hsp20/alpha crystallin family protein [Natronosporangium sp.]|nr:Hsp20/alpha crystallin family protein [Natronosporangium sp.]